MQNLNNYQEKGKKTWIIIKNESRTSLEILQIFLKVLFIVAQFTIAKCWKQRKCPSVNEWIKKLWYIYTMEYYSAERMKELRPFVTAWMKLESIMLSEISQVVKDKYHMISPISET